MTTSKKRYPKLLSEMAQFPGCCGIGVIYDIREDDGENWWQSTPVKVDRPYKTRLQQAKAWYDTDIKGQSEYATLMISLVSAYKGTNVHQHQHVEELLIKKGWTINSVFINPNHGNEITLYSKYFPEVAEEIEDNNQYG